MRHRDHWRQEMLFVSEDSITDAKCKTQSGRITKLLAVLWLAAASSVANGQVATAAATLVTVENYNRAQTDAYVKKGRDGLATIQFGNCDGAVPNCLPITPGWNFHRALVSSARANPRWLVDIPVGATREVNRFAEALRLSQGTGTAALFPAGRRPTRSSDRE